VEAESSAPHCAPKLTTWRSTALTPLEPNRRAQRTPDTSSRGGAYYSTACGFPCGDLPAPYISPARPVNSNVTGERRSDAKAIRTDR
jgi:hypothetical protein